MYTYEYPRPMLTADCVVTRPDGMLLLVQRSRDPFRGCWALPGGFMEMDETIEHCAARELREETGIAVDPAALTLVGVYSAPGRDPRGRTVTAAYRLEVPLGTAATAGDDAAQLRWWPVDALPPLAFDHRQIVADALRPAAAGNRLSANA